MATFKEQVDAAFEKINTATNNIAADIKKLSEQIAGGVSAEDAQAVVNKLNETAAKLEEIAATTPEDTTPPVEQ